MLFRGFDPPILFGIGEPDPLSTLILELTAQVVLLQLRVEAMEALQPAYRVESARPVWRMGLEAASAEEVDAPVEMLDARDLDALERLYADGYESGEAPDFFFAEMLEQGTFRGIREGSDLVAVAGTHLFAPDVGVCTIGNVYTRRDRRGHGFGARVTRAVVEHARAHGVETVALNVRQPNVAARRVYERLGFRVHCAFIEGRAHRCILAPDAQATRARE